MMFRLKPSKETKEATADRVFVATKRYAGPSGREWVAGVTENGSHYVYAMLEDVVWLVDGEGK